VSIFAAVVVSALLLPLSPVAARLRADRAAAWQAASRPEVVAAIQVHGNTITSTEEVVRAAGIAVGDHVSENMLTEAETRLRAAIKPDSVDVLKRFASISDPTQVLILIQLDEGPVRVDIPDIEIHDVDKETPKAPILRPRSAVVRRARVNMMFVPILGAEDGYGLTYGAQFAFMGHRNTRRRIVVPASWGGDKRIGAEFQQEFRRRFAPRLRTGAMLQRRTHPFYDDNADRTRVWGRTEWPIVRDVRTGAEVAWQSSALAGEETEARSIGADVIIDTRVDPLMPHNAVFVRSAVERLRFSSSTTAVRTEIDANGYVGIYRGTVLALRAVREDFSRPAPAFYKSVLGGSRNLRGFRAGRAVGDTLVAGSIELRIPTTSPLRMTRFGYSVFVDAATTYNKGQRFRHQKLERGVGGGIWMTAPLFRFSAAVARGLGSGVRAHIGAGLTF
jgi:outer membrane protein assembly factor BamA